MQSSNIPPKIVKPFANAASGSYVNAIPVNSQIPTAPGRASLADGFPPLTFQPLDNGGVPPFGADMNGILKSITAIQQWQEAGGGFPYDATFSSTNNGYPAGAVVQSSSGNGYWSSLVDNNTTNPDTDTVATNWIPYNFTGSSTISVTSPTTTVTNLQAAYPFIIIQGALTADTTVIFPQWVKTWVVYNNTTGAFKLTVKPTTGTGIALVQGANSHIAGGGSIRLADTFSSFLAANGYQVLPSGLIIQWGNASTTNPPSFVNFPIAFPNAVFSVLAGESSASAWGGGTTPSIHGVGGASLSGFNNYAVGWNGTAWSLGAASTYWIAIGY